MNSWKTLPTSSDLRKWTSALLMKLKEQTLINFEAGRRTQKKRTRMKEDEKDLTEKEERI